MTISYKVGLNDEGARATLQGLVQRMDNPRGFYQNVGELLLNSSKDNFDREADPDGIPWKRLMPKTIKRREEKGLTPIRILRARGRLVGSLNIAAGDNEVRIGSPMKYAAIHQLGGVIKKKERISTIFQHYDAKADVIDQKFRKKSKSNFARDVTVKEHDIDMPARRYLGVSKEAQDEIIVIGRRWLADE